MGLFSRSRNLSEAEFERARNRMVETQLAGRDVADKSVLEAMRKIPRHHFVPVDNRNDAYGDSPLSIGCGQTISQPYIVASMTQFLHPEKNKRVLEIGTGSGYQTAVLAELFEHVVSVEYFEELSLQARDILGSLGYHNITFYTGDGLRLPDTLEKFEAVIVTAAPEKIPSELMARLTVGGRMLIPVGKTVQYLKLVTRKPDDGFDIQTLYQVRFVPLQ